MKGRFGIGFRGGLSFPIGGFGAEGNYATSFSDSLFETGMKEKGSATMGYGFGFEVEYFVTGTIAIGGYFDYQMYGMNLDAMKDDIEAAIPDEVEGLTIDMEGDHHITSFGVFGKYAFDVSPKLSPFLKLGLGMGKLSSTIDMTFDYATADPFESALLNGERNSGMKLCFDMGGGIMYQLSGSLWITGEFRYRHLATDGVDGDVDVIVTAKAGTEERQLFHQQWKDEFDFNVDCIDGYLGLSFFFGG
jgi:opacity protein-like surface antigen